MVVQVHTSLNTLAYLGETGKIGLNLCNIECLLLVFAGRSSACGNGVSLKFYSY